MCRYRPIVSSETDQTVMPNVALDNRFAAILTGQNVDAVKQWMEENRISGAQTQQVSSKRDRLILGLIIVTLAAGAVFLVWKRMKK